MKASSKFSYLKNFNISNFYNKNLQLNNKNIKFQFHSKTRIEKKIIKNDSTIFHSNSSFLNKANLKRIIKFNFSVKNKEKKLEKEKVIEIEEKILNSSFNEITLSENNKVRTKKNNKTFLDSTLENESNKIKLFNVRKS